MLVFPYMNPCARREWIFILQGVEFGLSHEEKEVKRRTRIWKSFGTAALFFSVLLVGHSYAFSQACNDNDGDGFLDCANDCNDSDALINPLALDEICDGVDDNCNGFVDEDFMPTNTICGVGKCGHVGNLICADGLLTDTCVPGVPDAFDVDCDNIDDDCDGLVDEG